MPTEIKEKYVASMSRMVFGKKSTPFTTVEEWWKAVIDELKKRERIER